MPLLQLATHINPCAWGSDVTINPTCHGYISFWVRGSRYETQDDKTKGGDENPILMPHERPLCNITALLRLGSNPETKLTLLLGGSEYAWLSSFLRTLYNMLETSSKCRLSAIKGTQGKWQLANSGWGWASHEAITLLTAGSHTWLWHLPCLGAFGKSTL